MSFSELVSEESGRILKQLLESLREAITYIMSDPIFVLWLGFIVALVCISQALSRGGTFSQRAAIILGTILAIYSAATIAEALPSLGQVVATIILFALPVAIFIGLLRRGRR